MNNESKNGNNIKSEVKYEEGILDIFDKLPIWLRWLIFIPAAFIGYFIIYYIAYLGWYWYRGDIFTNGYVGQSLQNIIFVAVPLIIIHSCIPKYKFVISIIFSSLYIILGIASITMALYFRPHQIDLSYFFTSILPGLIIVTIAIIMIIGFIKHKYENNQ